MYESQRKLNFCGDNDIPNHPLAVIMTTRQGKFTIYIKCNKIYLW